MITVSTVATKVALTTVAAVKTQLKMSGNADNDWIGTQIDSATSQIANYLGVEMAEDGTRNLARESLIETIDRRARYGYNPPFGVSVPLREADSIIVLGRRPVVSIASITENGTVLDPADYQLSATSGKVKRLSSSLVSSWPNTIIVVTYDAGWLMPGVNRRNLPAEIEDAAISLVEIAWFSRGQNPLVKSETIPGVRQVDYFFGAPGQGSPLPPDISVKLDPYRNISL